MAIEALTTNKKDTFKKNKALWENQMIERKQESEAQEPNSFAESIAKKYLLPEGGVIFEIGPGDTLRDAIAIAKENRLQFPEGRKPTILAADITLEAIKTIYNEKRALLQQLGIKYDGIRAGAQETSYWTNLIDRNSQETSKHGEIDMFYARSSLHLDTQELEIFMIELTTRLKPGGYICIEGKMPNDTKMTRSIEIRDGLWSDPQENGHVRRLWTRESIEKLCQENRLTLIEVKTHEDKYGQFINFIAKKQDW